MNMRWLGWLLMLVLVSGCAPAAGVVDDAAQLARAVTQNYGDDVARNAQLLAGKAALQTSDDYARMISSSLDEMLLSQSVDELAQQFAGTSDDILRRAPTAIDYQPPKVVYHTSRAQWPRMQQQIADKIGSQLGLVEEKADLFLQTTCWVVDYVKLNEEYPSTEYSLFFIYMKALDNQMESEKKWLEFIGDVNNFIENWVKESGEADLQAASELMFDGMCLIN